MRNEGNIKSTIRRVLGRGVPSDARERELKLKIMQLLADTGAGDEEAALRQRRATSNVIPMNPHARSAGMRARKLTAAEERWLLTIDIGLALERQRT